MRPSEADLAQLGVPYPLLPTRLRRMYETRCMILLSGYLVEDLMAARGAPVPEPLPEPLPEPVLTVAAPALSRREAETLSRAGAGNEPETDASQALRTLTALHCGNADLAMRHAAFLHAETGALMAGRKARAMVTTLASELMTYRTLPARRWREVLAGVT